MINYAKIIDFVKEKHKGHNFSDFDHIERVHNICLEVARGQEVNEDLLRVAAYLHDIAVPEFGPANHNERAEEVAGRDFLLEVGVPAEDHDFIYQTIWTHTRYSDQVPSSLEGEILRDADGLDYIGSIGVLRAIMREFKSGRYTGNINRDAVEIMESLVPRVAGTFSTKRAQEIAAERIDYLNSFIEELIKEIEVGQ